MSGKIFLSAVHSVLFCPVELFNSVRFSLVQKFVSGDMASRYRISQYLNFNVMYISYLSQQYYNT
jgi:hypothetical protein